MACLARGVIAFIFAAAFSTAGLAQKLDLPDPGLPNPDMRSRIPAPLPPPAQPPIINGPLSQSPPPGGYRPPQLNTFSDRVTACVHQGASAGLKGGDLDAYTRSCANAR